MTKAMTMMAVRPFSMSTKATMRKRKSPLWRNEYVDSSDRPYRVVAPVDPLRRLYHPPPLRKGRGGLSHSYLRSSIPPPTQRLRRRPPSHPANNYRRRSSQRPQQLVKRPAYDSRQGHQQRGYRMNVTVTRATDREGELSIIPRNILSKRME